VIRAMAPIVALSLTTGALLGMLGAALGSVRKIAVLERLNPSALA